ncbi:MAG: 3-keto-5-aminohexanoate cleavage protein [Candidatus Eisenbacteria bacterium]
MGSGFIINFTPTGMIPTKAMTPRVPISPAEIVAQVDEVARLGVNMVHLHARDPETGQPSHRREVYAEIIRGIRAGNPELIISVSTSGRQVAEFEKRSEVLDLEGELRPDCGSLTLSSLNFNKQASVNSPQMIQDLAAKMRARGIRPELEAFDLGMINYAKYLAKKGLLDPPYYFNLILGNIACAQASMLSLGLMINELPPGAIWSVGGVGDSQLSMNAMAIVAGGGVRVGLEDNIWYDEERTRLATNSELVERVLVIGRAMGRRPYATGEARAVLGLPIRGDTHAGGAQPAAS